MLHPSAQHACDCPSVSSVAFRFSPLPQGKQDLAMSTDGGRDRFPAPRWNMQLHIESDDDDDDDDEPGTRGGNRTRAEARPQPPPQTPPPPPRRHGHDSTNRMASNYRQQQPGDRPAGSARPATTPLGFSVDLDREFSSPFRDLWPGFSKLNHVSRLPFPTLRWLFHPCSYPIP